VTLPITHPNCVPVPCSEEKGEQEPFAVLDSPLERGWGLGVFLGSWGCWDTYAN